MNNALIIALLVVALIGGGFAFKASVEISDLEADKVRLTTANAAMAESVRNLADQRDLAQDAAILAQKERARVAAQAVKYETIRDAFREGNFDAALPDDFKLLVDCLLWRSTGRNTERANCP